MKEEITMPNGWSEVSIKQWKKLIEAAETIEDENELSIKFISTLSGLDVETIESLPLPDTIKLAQSIRFINTTKPDSSKKINKEYEINGKTYVLIKDMKKLTTAGYIDFQNYAGEMDKNICQVLSVALIPKGEKYGEYDVSEVIEDLDNYFNVEDALSVISFFGKKFRKLMECSLRSSKKQMKKTLKTLKKRDPEAYKKAMERVDSSGFNL